MTMDRYIALVHHEGDSWGIGFPDLPGCTAVADSFEAVLEQGGSAMQVYVDVLVEHGEVVPRPRTLDELATDPAFQEDREGAVLATVPLLPQAGRAKRINFTVDEALLVEIDRVVARREGYSRSRFFEDAARRMLVAS